MDTAWVWQAVVTEWTLPPVRTRAFSWGTAESLQQVAALLADSSCTVSPYPALHTSSIPKLVTHVVAMPVIAWPAQLVALAAIVVLVTAHADAVLKAGCKTVVLDSLSVISWVDPFFTDTSLNQQILTTAAVCTIVPVPRFHDQSVRNWPSELEWDDDLSTIVVSVLVVFGALKLKTISTDNVSRSSSIDAQALGRDIRLVFL